MKKSKHFEMYFSLACERDFFDGIFDAFLNSGYYAEWSSMVAITSDDIIRVIDDTIETYSFDVVFGNPQKDDEQVFIKSICEWIEN